eukprot:2829090-Amphidinium_carterae.1
MPCLARHPTMRCVEHECSWASFEERLLLSKGSASTALHRWCIHLPSSIQQHQIRASVRLDDLLVGTIGEQKAAVNHSVRRGIVGARHRDCTAQEQAKSKDRKAREMEAIIAKESAMPLLVKACYRNVTRSSKRSCTRPRQ